MFFLEATRTTEFQATRSTRSLYDSPIRYSNDQLIPEPAVCTRRAPASRSHTAKMIMLMRDVYPQQQSRPMPVYVSSTKQHAVVKLLYLVRDAAVLGAYVTKLIVTMSLIRILGDSSSVVKAVEILTQPAILATLTVSIWFSSSSSLSAVATAQMQNL